METAKSLWASDFVVNVVPCPCSLPISGVLSHLRMEKSGGE